MKNDKYIANQRAKIGLHHSKMTHKGRKYHPTSPGLDFSKSPIMGLIVTLSIISMVTPCAASTTITKTPNRKDLVPCGSQVKQYLPKDMPQLAPSVSMMMTMMDCNKNEKVPALFNEANAQAYGSEVCLQQKTMDVCKHKFGLSSHRKLPQISLNTKDDSITLVHESNYAIVPIKSTVVTADISFCVAIAITHPHAKEVFLAHVNAENIKASDAHLKDKRLINPFAAIETFLQQHSTGWEATLVSGSMANSAYMRTLLSKMGVENIQVHCNTEWAITKNSGQISGGSLIIHKGRTLALKNSKQFSSLIKPILAENKNTPMVLTPCNKAEPPSLKMEL